mmetsp:Transcript_22768/g.71297  ORF Transcript_22768/g.71297 Transcript_22768/m.71297 type:complete len:619 (+) Transcript_22768:8-1864(+)
MSTISGGITKAPSGGLPAGLLACQACRMSKVKCDIPEDPDVPCSRCTRLGLKCFQPPAAKRGRPPGKRDTSRVDASRVVPAVRKLLNMPAGPAAAGVVTVPGVPVVRATASVVGGQHAAAASLMGPPAAQTLPQRLSLHVATPVAGALDAHDPALVPVVGVSREQSASLSSGAGQGRCDTTVSNSGAHGCSSPCAGADHGKCEDALHTQMMTEFASLMMHDKATSPHNAHRDAQLMLVRQWVLIAQRDGSCERLGMALLTAHRLGLRTDEVMVTPSNSSDTEAAMTLADVPEYIKEFQDGPHMCMLRHMCDGLIRLQPNRAMVNTLSAGREDLVQLPNPPTTLDSVVKAMQYMASVPFVGDFVRCLPISEMTVLVTSMFKQLCAEGGTVDASVPRHSSALGKSAFTVNYHGRILGPFRLQGRLVVKDGGRISWSSVRFIACEAVAGEVIHCPGPRTGMTIGDLVPRGPTPFDQSLPSGPQSAPAAPGFAPGSGGVSPAGPGPEAGSLSGGSGSTAGAHTPPQEDEPMPVVEPVVAGYMPFLAGLGAVTPSMHRGGGAPAPGEGADAYVDDLEQLIHDGMFDDDLLDNLLDAVGHKSSSGSEGTASSAAEPASAIAGAQ